jgi:tRNA(Ile)-lysidine synthase TilS/MesJ
VHPLALKTVEHIRRLELLKAGDRVGVAVSGGADSVQTCLACSQANSLRLSAGIAESACA